MPWYARRDYRRPDMCDPNILQVKRTMPDKGYETGALQTVGNVAGGYQLCYQLASPTIIRVVHYTALFSLSILSLIHI